MSFLPSLFVRDEILCPTELPWDLGWQRSLTRFLLTSFLWQQPNLLNSLGRDRQWMSNWVMVSRSDIALPQLLPPWDSLTLSRRSSTRGQPGSGEGARAASACSSRQEWARLLPTGAEALLGQSS